MKLVPVGRDKKSPEILYELLAERGPDESISHKEMPTWAEHLKFVRSNPYQCWYLIVVKNIPVGACYISKQREIGISIFKCFRRQGYAKQAIQMLIDKWPGRFYANINPENGKSFDLFASLGFTTLQHTLVRHR